MQWVFKKIFRFSKKLFDNGIFYAMIEAETAEAGTGGRLLSINFDISALMMVEQAVSAITCAPCGQREENIAVVNVNDLLDGLIEQSVALVGKPVALMNKDDKVRAIQFLSQHGWSPDSASGR